jgi:hypothetical protein
VRRAIIHPKLKGSFHNHWPSFCAILKKGGTRSLTGQVTGATLTPVAGMSRIPASLAPMSETSTRDNEIRTMPISTSQSERILKLNGYFPKIIVGTHSARVDGKVYNILGVEADSQKWSTRLYVEIVGG